MVDSAAGGLGGCPFAKGGAGNVATEDLVYMLEGMNIETGSELRKLIEAARFIASAIGQEPQSHTARIYSGG